MKTQADKLKDSIKEFEWLLWIAKKGNDLPRIKRYTEEIEIAKSTLINIM